MRWVTQERPKIDRIACPWLIRRFIDPDPKFLFVPARDVTAAAASAGAVPFDVPRGTPEAEFVHPDGGCTFDVFLRRFHLDDPALARVAAIVRAADNDNLRSTVPEAAGWRAISLGLAKAVRDDEERVALGFVLYDALYDWARKIAPLEEPAPPVRLRDLVGHWLAQAHMRRALGDLDAHLLRDIGIDADVARRESSKPFWRE
jgi:uncharacterized protein YjiS (DUF1127 family)